VQDKAVEDVKKLTGEIETIKAEKDKLQEDFIANQKAIDDIIKQNKENQEKGITAKDLIGSEMKKHTEKLSALKNQVGGSVSFDVKAAGTMLMANYTGGTIGLTSWDSEVTRPPLRKTFIRDIVTVRPVTGMYVGWAEIANRDGAVTTVAEGATKPLIDWDWVEATKKVEKLAGRLKISKEALADIPGASAEINQELSEQIALLLDSQVLSGDGVSPNLKGILTYTNTISVAATILALGVEAANNFDVLRAASWYIENIGNGRYNPNYAVINPIDAAYMDMSKSSQGVYIMPPFAAVNGQTIAGLRVITSTAITAGTFLVGDFSKDILGIREEMNIQFGYENDDFSKNLVSVVGEMRAVNYIKTNNINAFIKGTFATVRAAMETA
jgi:HK97 family phage major capsid protein